ncbi:FtsX-like permease family protein [Cellulosimicrobium sp. ES-005]|uniref:FtsX-like permease family protein n=1 Tax=Cellulosimicrobium sp. ES-005 TaxID=3163031 RepID=A0AAU8G0Y3_9MICO
MSTSRAPGRPRPTALVRDGVRSALAQPVATLTTAVVVAVVCLVVLATTGQSAAGERAVMATIDSTGTRLVTAADAKGDAGVAADGVAALARIDGVTWAFGTGSATDVRNADATARDVVPLRALYGSLPADVGTVSGRAPAEGEAVVGVDAARALGLVDGVGVLTDGVRSWEVVGVVDAAGPLASLRETALVATDPAGHEVRYVYAMARDVATVPALARLLPDVLPARSPGGVVVEEPTGAIALRDVVAGQLGAASRRLMTTVLAVGLVIVCATVFGAVSARRRDFGRRRALGATRSAIVVLVLVQTAVAASLGVAFGAAAGAATVVVLAGELPSASFLVGVAVLALAVCVVGAVPPAVVAARRDPVRILRVP